MLEYLTADTDHKGATRPAVVDLGGTLPGTNVRDMARAMGALHAARPSVSRYVAHAMLRWDEASGDKPDLAAQADMMTDHMRALGFDDFRMFSHGTEVHAIGSRIRADGSVVDERDDWRRAEHSVRALEVRFGLRQLECSPNAGGPRSHFEAPKARPISRGEMGLAHREMRDADRQGRDVDPAAMPQKPALADAVLAAREASLLDGATVGAFVRACHRAGVEVRPNWSPDSGKVSGLSFFLADAPEVEVTGSKLSRGMSWGNMLKGGISYEFGRDGAELRTASERAESVRPGRAAGRAADSGNQIVGGPSGGVPAAGRDADRDDAGRGVGPGADGRHAGPDGVEPEPDGSRDERRSDSAAGRGEPEHGGAGRAAGEHRGRDGATLPGLPAEAGGRRDEREPDREGVEGRAPGRGGVAAEDGARDPGDAARGGRGGEAEAVRPAADVHSHGHHHERLVSMAGVEDDRLAATLAAVGQAVRAVGAPFYVVGILPPRGTPQEEAARLHTLHKSYSAEQLAGAPVVKYLRAMNAQGHDIYFKPAGTAEGFRPPVVMVDDLTAEGIARMKADGLAPALEVTSSPQSHQAWVRVGKEPLPIPVLREVARELATRYGGDPLAAKGEQFGRLPGFTNRKPKRIAENGGKPPFARVVEAVGRLAAKAVDLVRACADRLRQEEAAASRRWDRAQAEAARRAKEREGEAVSASVARHMRASGARQSKEHGLSEIDFAAACGALRDGHSPDAVASALRHLSPGLEQRHARPDDYVARTVEKARIAVQQDYGGGGGMRGPR